MIKTYVICILFLIFEGFTAAPNQQEIQSRFDETVPKNARGFSNDNITLFCKVPNLHANETVYWIAPVYPWLEEQIGDSMHVRNDGDTWYLTLLNLTVMHRGEYTCRLKSAGTTASERVYHLSVLDFPGEYNWNSSRVCGYSNYINGKRGICDAEGTYPCCNSAGRCGYTKEDCECTSCIDFRNGAFNSHMKAELNHQLTILRKEVMENIQTMRQNVDTNVVSANRNLRTEVNRNTAAIAGLGVGCHRPRNCNEALRQCGYSCGSVNLYPNGSLRRSRCSCPK